MHQNLRKGVPIMAADGHELGKVKEIRGAYFKVNAPMAADYWLACDAVSGESGEGVRVSFAREHLDANKYPEPATI